jgi:hypothetical protein
MWRSGRTRGTHAWICRAVEQTGRRDTWRSSMSGRRCTWAWENDPLRSGRRREPNAIEVGIHLHCAPSRFRTAGCFRVTGCFRLAGRDMHRAWRTSRRGTIGSSPDGLDPMRLWVSTRMQGPVGAFCGTRTARNAFQWDLYTAATPLPILYRIRASRRPDVPNTRQPSQEVRAKVASVIRTPPPVARLPLQSS